MENYFKLTLLALLALSVISCSEDDDPGPEVRVQIQFSHYVGDQALQFNSIEYQNEAGNIYSVETLLYFVSDFKLMSTGGEEVLIDEIHYVDGRDESTLLFLSETAVPAGTYESLSFVFGLTEADNTPRRFPNTPENNMEWPPAMGSGYHYMKLEGKVDSSGVINNFQAHTGPTMNNQNFVEVTMPESSFTIDGDGQTISVIMDINKWWEDPNMLDLNEVTGIMGNQAMQEKLKANGADVFRWGGME